MPPTRAPIPSAARCPKLGLPKNRPIINERPVLILCPASAIHKLLIALTRSRGAMPARRLSRKGVYRSIGLRVFWIQHGLGLIIGQKCAYSQAARLETILPGFLQGVQGPFSLRDWR